VYYTGSDELLEGYALCYNFDASDVSAENLTLSAGVDEECPARRLQVEKPSINNSVHFAGVVSNKHASGFTGPGWVEINMPGSVCNIYAAASVDHGSTGTGMNSGQILTFDLDAYTFTYDGIIGEGSAIVLQDVDRSSTNGLVMAELCIGVPSGGVQTINSTHWAAEQVVSTGGALCISPFGVTYFTSIGLTALALTNPITCCLVAADGEWINQVKQFRTTTSVGATGLEITASTARNVGASVLTVVTPASLTQSIVSDNVTTTFTWTGAQWNIFTNSSVATIA
jgi:hypothetical protein